MMQFKTVLVLATIQTIAMAEKLPDFKLDSLALRFDKSSKYYIDRPVNEKEKGYTRDYRELSVVGKTFPKNKPLSILPAQYDRPKSPYEAIANYLFTVKQKNTRDIVALYDSVGAKHVDSSFQKKGVGEKFIDQISKVEKYEVSMIFEIPNLILVYGQQCTQKMKNYNPMFITAENGVFKIKAGLIDVTFWQTLGGAVLANDTNFIIRK